jgi:hypothetical protein
MVESVAKYLRNYRDFASGYQVNKTDEFNLETKILDAEVKLEECGLAEVLPLAKDAFYQAIDKYDIKSARLIAEKFQLTANDAVDIAINICKKSLKLDEPYIFGFKHYILPSNVQHAKHIYDAFNLNQKLYDDEIQSVKRMLNAFVIFNT